MKPPNRVLVLIALFAATISALSAQTATDRSEEKRNQTSPSSRQSPATQSSAPAPVASNPNDVDSLDHIIAALYDVISGPKEKKRDWDRMRSLFFPGAHMIPAVKPPAGEFWVRMFTVEDYIDRSRPYFEKEGFFEVEIARRTETFGHITHAWSTYASRHAPAEAPFARGINSIQLVNDGKRWWALNIFWEGERDDNKLPDRYLKRD